MENKNIVIGIEGLVGAGKTSICKELLNYIPNSIILHGGNIYRGIVYGIKNKKINIKKNIDAHEIMNELNIKIKLENRETVIYIDDKKIEDEDLQSNENSLAVSKISNKADNSKLYEFGKKLIDDYRKKYNIILSSRDIVKMYPDVTYHFFITASIDERIRRKFIQYNGKLSQEQIKETIEKRDKLQKETGYYDIYDNTKIIDVTNCKNVKESCEKVLDNIKLEAVI